MADNVAITAGSGTSISAAEVTTLNGATVAAVEMQRAKMAYGTGATAREVDTAFPLPVSTQVEASATFRGRVASFRTPGRAGTTGQKLFALHNATGSTKVVTLNSLGIDTVATAVIASTVIPPIIRVYRFTALPTGGTALTKVAKDSSLASNASVTAWGDASADGTGSATALTITLGAALTQEFAPRLITAAGYEMFDRTVLLDGGVNIILRALEGVVVMLDYTLATANPTTNSWLVTCDWVEV